MTEHFNQGLSEKEQSTSRFIGRKVAETQDQAKQLIEAGLDYVMPKDNLAYFRKRK